MTHVIYRHSAALLAPLIALLIALTSAGCTVFTGCSEDSDCGGVEVCSFDECVACRSNAQCTERLNAVAVCQESGCVKAECNAEAPCEAPSVCDVAQGRCATFGADGKRLPDQLFSNVTLSFAEPSGDTLRWVDWTRQLVSAMGGGELSYCETYNALLGLPESCCRDDKATCTDAPSLYGFDELLSARFEGYYTIAAASLGYIKQAIGSGHVVVVACCDRDYCDMFVVTEIDKDGGLVHQENYGLVETAPLPQIYKEGCAAFAIAPQ